MSAGEEIPPVEAAPASLPPVTSLSPCPGDETPWDLASSSPAAFTYILKSAYADGKESASKKFQALRTLVTLSLPTAPPPGPSTFTVKCLEALVAMDPPFNEGLSHLLTSAINHLDSRFKTEEDVKCSRRLAAFMLRNAVTGVIVLNARILVKLVVVFGIQLKDVGEVATALDADESAKIQEAKELVAPFILGLVRERGYTSAVALLKQFDLQDCMPRDFLITMVTDGEPDLAGQWAAHMGIDMCCYLVQRCIVMGQYKLAHRLVQRHKLEHHFPDSYILYKQSSLRKLAGRGLWDVAESIALTDPGLQEYLVALAIEEGDTAQVAELCERFQMEQLPSCSVIINSSVNNDYIKLSDVMPTDKVCWVDSIESLASAKEHFRFADMVGLDSEWKANHIKGSQENKVSILQLATVECVFIFDMLHLSGQLPAALDDCLKLVFHAPNMLKLGYAVNNDLERLVHSYQGLECFSVCESLLDLQTFAGHTKGGLSGLTKLAVGGSLDKRARMSDWEKRPLTEKQLRYAALDAAVLVSIFEYLQTAPDSDGNPVIRDYKPYLKTFRVPQKRSKKALHSYDIHGERAESGDSSGAGGIFNRAEEVDIVSDIIQGTRVNSSAGIEVCEVSVTESESTPACTTERDKTLDTPGIPSQRDSEASAIYCVGPEQYGELLSACEPPEETEMLTAADDLVSATFELVGEPRPGLLKSKLQEFTQAAGFPLPMYQAQSYGPGHLLSFRCAVEVGGFRFWGNTAFKKRDAELFAAQKALSFFQAESLKYAQQQTDDDAPVWIRSLKASGWLSHWGQFAIGTYQPETIANKKGSDSATSVASANIGYHWRSHTRVRPPRSFWFTGQLSSSGSFSAVNSSFLDRRIVYRARKTSGSFHCGPSIGVHKWSHILLLM